MPIVESKVANGTRLTWLCQLTGHWWKPIMWQGLIHTTSQCRVCRAIRSWDVEWPSPEPPVGDPNDHGGECRTPPVPSRPFLRPSPAKQMEILRKQAVTLVADPRGVEATLIAQRSAQCAKNAEKPDTILGVPVVINPDMKSEPMVFGDPAQ
jgi:hypothetical protein